MLNLELQTELQPFLFPNERLIWIGQPEKGLRFQTKDWFITMFMIFWTGFSVFWTVMASATGGPFGLFGIPFMCVGVYMLVGRFFYDAHLRDKMIYGVTNQRILIREGVFSRETKSYNIHDLPCLDLVQNDGNKGSILFDKEMETGSGKHRRTISPPQFDTIEDVVRVFQLITQQKAIAL
jgi:hypothetical protein